ncbi:unnamed protein product [Durusdinium trenchii]|uniref:Uncharacterized protein n=1 Tax=Durusdinium trenchii TaxID=1381693 RepID=A0ABP0QET0_9DINO
MPNLEHDDLVKTMQAMIEQRDSLNASIEEHMRRQNLELPLVTDPTSKVALAFLVPEVESQWRNEGCQDQIVVGSLFLALCELLLRISSLWKDLRHGCGLKGLMASMALKAGVIYNGCAFVILVPFALWNTRLKSRRLLLALTIFAYLDRILASMPLLHYACGRGRDTSPQCETFPSKKDCQMMEYHRFHVQMLSVMAQVLVLPEYRYCSYMWIWIFLATLVSSVFVANEEIRSVLTGTRDRVLLTTEGKLDVEDAKNEFFVRLKALGLFSAWEAGSSSRLWGGVKTQL